MASQMMSSEKTNEKNTTKKLWYFEVLPSANPFSVHRKIFTSIYIFDYSDKERGKDKQMCFGDTGHGHGEHLSLSWKNWAGL